MANKALFRSVRELLAPKANTLNEAGGPAYRRSDKQALAQYAATGCLGATFYTAAKEQLEAILKLCEAVEPEFIARTAIYCRQRGYMKDTPALLLAVLSVRSSGLLAAVFERVVDSPKILRNFVQIIRSGVVGRKSLGSLPKRLVQQWIESRSATQLFIGSVGNDPSLTDIVKMVHPKPTTPERQSLYGYLAGRKHNAELLPELVRHYERFKRMTHRDKITVPDVPFQMLTSLSLTKKEWHQVALTASWQTTRMNINTFQRHGVFKDQKATAIVADRLRNPQLIEKAKAFPYQLMIAYMNAGAQVPLAIREALQDAMELSLRNVPRISGKVYVCLDVSGSMHSPITGHRRGAATAGRCVDVAALLAAAIVRRNPEAEVLPFNEETVDIRVNPRDTVITNANKLASFPCGGTDCSAPLRTLNARHAKGNLVIFVSDNQSWLDGSMHRSIGHGTATMQEWSRFKTRNPQTRMICIDIQPSGTTQGCEREDIVNVGGFSDQVFDLLAEVASGRYNGDHWVATIEDIRL